MVRSRLLSATSAISVAEGCLPFSRGSRPRSKISFGCSRTKLNNTLNVRALANSSRRDRHAQDFERREASRSRSPNCRNSSSIQSVVAYRERTRPRHRPAAVPALTTRCETLQDASASNFSLGTIELVGAAGSGMRAVIRLEISRSSFAESVSLRFTSATMLSMFVSASSFSVPSLVNELIPLIALCASLRIEATFATGIEESFEKLGKETE